MSEDAIGANLRKIRHGAGMSLSKAADLTGVSKAMLGQIERGESSPTIATLWKIAKGFHLPLSALIGELDAAQPDPAEPFKTVQFPGSIAVKIVFPFDPELGGETFRISLTPGTMFSASGRYEHCLRLNCALPWSDRVADAVATLGRLATEQPR